jgi:hypothetical protein
VSAEDKRKAAKAVSTVTVVTVPDVKPSYITNGNINLCDLYSCVAVKGKGKAVPL